MFFSLKHNHQVMLENSELEKDISRDSALRFSSVQISNLKHSTGPTVIYHVQMDIMDNMEQSITNIWF